MPSEKQVKCLQGPRVIMNIHQSTCTNINQWAIGIPLSQLKLAMGSGGRPVDWLYYVILQNKC